MSEAGEAYDKAKEQVKLQRMYEGRSTRSGNQTYQDGFDAAVRYIEELERSQVDVVSAVVERLSAVQDEHPKPKLQVGTLVPLENGDFVIEHIESKWDGDGEGHGLVHVMLQDRKSWDRKHRLYDLLGDPTPTPRTLPSILDWADAKAANKPKHGEDTCPRTGCDRLAGHMGVHTNGSDA